MFGCRIVEGVWCDVFPSQQRIARIGVSLFAVPETGQLLPGQQRYIPLAAMDTVCDDRRQCSDGILQYIRS